MRRSLRWLAMIATRSHRGSSRNRGILSAWVTPTLAVVPGEPIRAVTRRPLRSIQRRSWRDWISDVLGRHAGQTRQSHTVSSRKGTRLPPAVTADGMMAALRLFFRPSVSEMAVEMTELIARVIPYYWAHAVSCKPLAIVLGVALSGPERPILATPSAGPTNGVRMDRAAAAGQQQQLNERCIGDCPESGPQSHGLDVSVSAQADHGSSHDDFWSAFLRSALEKI